MSSAVTLAVDIGGTGLKLLRVDADGNGLGELLRLPTPAEKTPKAIFEAMRKGAVSMGSFDRVSVGFPGVVIEGVTYNAPNLNDELFTRFPLTARLAELFSRPVRAVNDADMQGLGVVRGEGVELVITLGTGLGSGLFLDGRLVPNLELGHHPFRNGGTYEDYVADRTLKEIGKAAWSRRVPEVLTTLRALFSMNHIYLGGGNLRYLSDDLGRDVTTFELATSLRGAVRLWDPS